MNFTDLRAFISFLEERNQLVRIKEHVTWDLEITEIADRQIRAGGPALLFENVDRHETPVLINLYGTAQRVAWSLGVNEIEELSNRVRSLLDMTKGPPQGFINKLNALGNLAKITRYQPKLIKKAPCQEVVLTGDEVDLFKFPILRCWPLDGGRTITFPLVITKNPITGSRNVGTYRMQVYDKRTTGMHWQTHKVGAEHYRRGAESGLKRMDVAVAIGVDPTTVWTGSAPLPPEMDEMQIAGFIRERGVDLVKCVSVDLEVPAHSEIVLEGYVELGELRNEGPFGDHTGYYSFVDEYPVFHVTTITHRKDPIYLTVVVGKPPKEDYFMGKASERIFLPVLQMVLPELIDINLPAEGVFQNLMIASIKKEYPGHAHKVMNAIWGLGGMALTKTVVIVDHFVNVQNLSDVAWRVATHLNPRKDLIFSTGPLDDLDVGSGASKFGSKLGVDATQKWKGEGYQKPWPNEVYMNEEISNLVNEKWLKYGF